MGLFTLSTKIWWSLVLSPSHPAGRFPIDSPPLIVVCESSTTATAPRALSWGLCHSIPGPSLCGWLLFLDLRIPMRQ